MPNITYQVKLDTTELETQMKQYELRAANIRAGFGPTGGGPLSQSQTVAGITKAELLATVASGNAATLRHAISTDIASDLGVASYAGGLSAYNAFLVREQGSIMRQLFTNIGQSIDAVRSRLGGVDSVLRPLIGHLDMEANLAKKAIDPSLPQSVQQGLTGIWLGRERQFDSANEAFKALQGLDRPLDLRLRQYKFNNLMSSIEINGAASLKNQSIQGGLTKGQTSALGALPPGAGKMLGPGAKLARMSGPALAAATVMQIRSGWSEAYSERAKQGDFFPTDPKFYQDANKASNKGLGEIGLSLLAAPTGIISALYGTPAEISAWASNAIGLTWASNNIYGPAATIFNSFSFDATKRFLGLVGPGGSFATNETREEKSSRLEKAARTRELVTNNYINYANEYNKAIERADKLATEATDRLLSMGFSGTREDLQSKLAKFNRKRAQQEVNEDHGYLPDFDPTTNY